MKKILASLLICFALCATAKDKPDPAFAKGDITVAAAYGSQTLYGLTRSVYEASSNASVFGEYQLSRNFNIGVQYSYNYYDQTLLRLHYNIDGRVYLNGPTYQQERSAWGNYILATADYCYLNRGRISLSAGLGVGVSFVKNWEHIIDSAGISTYRTFPLTDLAIQLQLVNAKVRVNENWGLYGGLGLGYRGILSLGAHYTFNRHKN
jgi:opacity protein-like surface antigen